MNRAIIVREKVGRLVKLMTEKDIRVTQRGSKAYVEYATNGCPRLVNIPYIPDDADSTYLDAIEGFLDHEVAHVLFTDYKELARAKKAHVSNMHNIIEDAYIEQRMAREFAGSGHNLKNVGEFFLRTYTDKRLKEDPKNAVAYLMVPAVRAMSGQAVFIDYMADKWGYLDDVMKKIGEYAKKVLPTISSSKEAVDVAIEFKRLLDTPDEESEGEDSDEGESKSGKGKSKSGDTKGKPSDEPAEGAEPESEGEGDTEDSGGGPGEDEGEGEGEGEPAEPEIDIDGDIDVEDHASSVSEEEKERRPEDKEPEKHESGVRSFGPSDYDGDPKPASTFESIEDSIEDFDSKLAEELSKIASEESKSADYLIYTKELDVVEPMKVGDRGRWDDSMLKMIQDEVDHMVAPLQKDLERAIAARSASTWSAGHRSGRLHSSALARLTTFNDDRAFRRKHVNNSKDVAVSLLVDCSGSMNGAKIRTAAYAAYGLSSVLDRMNINHEVLGFTTLKGMPPECRTEEKRLDVRYARQQSLYIPVLKSFGERLATENKKRFAALPEVYWLSENVDGESVQIAATRLMQRRESRKILIVLSDGQPACPGDFAALQRHLKKVVKDVERQGVDVLGLGIMSEAPKHYYSKYTLLNNLAELPTTVIGEIKRLLMQA